jgi:hypothetical protein
MKPSVPLLLLVLSLTGCQTKVWYQPGKTEAQIRRDWADSQLAARHAALGIRQPLVFSDNDFAAGLALATQRDAAHAARDIAPLTMQAKGYQLVPLSSVPTNAAYLKR